MFYKNLLLIFVFMLFSNCTTTNLSNNKTKVTFKKNFTNKGFALIYNDNLNIDGTISKKIEERSLIIFQKNLKKNTQVKITNLLNNKSLIAIVGKKAEYPLFNNSVISKRIATELQLDINEAYIEIIAISENSLFIAKKAKTFEEEKNVANKVPVKAISINDLNTNKIDNKKVLINKFSYVIKIADFYFEDTASMMIKRIKDETNTQKPRIKKISNNQYRVYLGPFRNINSLQKSFNDINILEFDNIEIIKND